LVGDSYAALDERTGVVDIYGTTAVTMFHHREDDTAPDAASKVSTSY
jgi:hypothetical protein